MLETIKELKKKLYPYDNRLAFEEKRIKESKEVTPENKRLISEFLDFCRAQNLTIGRIYKSARVMRQLAFYFEKLDFDKATREDIQRIVVKIHSSTLTDWGKNDLIVFLKKFYKWLRKTDIAPSEVAWIKRHEPENKLSKHDLINREELKLIINACLNVRDKALLGMLYETAARPMEILTLTRDRIHETPDGSAFEIEIRERKTKYSNRKLLVLEFAPFLRDWLAANPLKEPNSLVFLGLARDNKDKILTHSALHSLIRGIVKRAGVNKRVYPYLFRHSRLTELDLVMKERVHKKFAGHAPDSRMARVYSHLNDDDTLQVLRENYLQTQDKKKVSENATKELLNLLLTPQTAEYLIDQAVKDGKAQKIAELLKLVCPTNLTFEDAPWAGLEPAAY